MKLGIGLPNTVSGYRHFPGRRLVEWAQRAEERGFHGLATLDRVAYGNYDSLATLAAAAGASSRIELLTNILLAPLYSTPVLAKQTATVDAASAGRLTLGLAPGGREDDYAVAGRDFGGRGPAFDRQLEDLHSAWDGSSEHSLPADDGRKIPVLVGGSGKAALRRGLRWGAGFAIGGTAPDAAAETVARLRQAWVDSDRTEEPRIAALAYFGLGAETEAESQAYLRHYYADMGDYAELIATNALRSEDAVRAAVAAYEEAGVTELYLDPTTAGLEQVDRLADVVLR